MKLRRNDIVRVHWLDQSYYTGPAIAEGAIQKAHGLSVGYFIEECKEWLCIASEHFTTDSVSYRHIMTFPKCAVTKVELIFKEPKDDR